MVAHDPKTGAATNPTRRAEDGTFPHDPQINVPDREVDPKPAARLSGYVAGGTTQPSEGQSGDPVYTDPDGNEVEPAAVLNAAVDEAASGKKKGK